MSNFNPTVNNGNSMSMAQLAKLNKAAIKEADRMASEKILNTCSVTGKQGIYGDDIKAARFIVERNGVDETFRMLVHRTIKAGRKFRGGRIKSVRRAGMRASIKKAGVAMTRYAVITG